MILLPSTKLLFYLFFFNKIQAYFLFQFEKPVLDVVLGLLDKGELADSARNNVSSIIRCLSALVSSISVLSQFTVMCLSIGTPKNNKFSICSKMEN